MTTEVNNLIIQRQANQIGSLMFENTKLAAERDLARQEAIALRKEKDGAAPEDAKGA